jgi:hypothetical protein
MRARVTLSASVFATPLNREWIIITSLELAEYCARRTEHAPGAAGRL